MAVDAIDLQAYVNAADNELPLLQTSLETAASLVDQYVGAAEVPTLLLDRAYLQVAADLFNMRRAPNGVLTTQFGGDLGAEPVRITRDPLVSVYKLLSQWVSPW